MDPKTIFTKLKPVKLVNFIADRTADCDWQIAVTPTGSEKDKHRLWRAVSGECKVESCLLDMDTHLGIVVILSKENGNHRERIRWHIQINEENIRTIVNYKWIFPWIFSTIRNYFQGHFYILRSLTGWTRKIRKNWKMKAQVSISLGLPSESALNSISRHVAHQKPRA